MQRFGYTWPFGKKAKYFEKSYCELKIMILHIDIGRIYKGPIPTLTHPNVT